MVNGENLLKDGISPLRLLYNGTNHYSALVGKGISVGFHPNRPKVVAKKNKPLETKNRFELLRDDNDANDATDANAENQEDEQFEKDFNDLKASRMEVVVLKDGDDKSKFKSCRKDANCQVLLREDDFFNVKYHAKTLNNPNVNEKNEKIVKQLFNKTTTFKDVHGMLQAGFDLVMKITKSESGLLHTMYMYSNNNNLFGKELAMYIGESTDWWERFKNHIAAMLYFARHGKILPGKNTDKKIFESLKNGRFFYTHVLIPSCSIVIIRMLEQIIIHCLKLCFAELELCNFVNNLPQDTLDFYGIGYESILAIGAVFLGNFLENNLFDVNVLNKTFVSTPVSFQCTMCTYSTSVTYRLRKHFIDIHSIKDLMGLEKAMNEIKKVPCPSPGCDKTFGCSAVLKRHLREVCAFCKDSTKCSNKNCTERVHTKQLDNHLKICKHSKSNIKRFPCPLKCGSTFAYASEVGRHLEHNCAVKRSLGEIKKQQCNFCGKMLGSMKSLNAHVSDVHTKPKPVCVCGKKYSGDKALKRHQKDCTKAKEKNQKGKNLKDFFN